MRRWRRRWLRWAIALAVLACGLVLGFTVYLDRVLAGTIQSFMNAQAQWTANRAIYQSILETVASEVRYTDVVRIEKDADQRVTLMQADVVKINRISAEATLKVQETMEKLAKERVSFPLGQILGIRLLAGIGPHVKLTMIPLGTARVEVVDSFESAGINQTRHRILLKVMTAVRVVVPFSSSEVEVATQVPIADAVIVGEVPGTYVILGGIQGTGITEP